MSVHSYLEDRMEYVLIERAILIDDNRVTKIVRDSREISFEIWTFLRIQGCFDAIDRYLLKIRLMLMKIIRLSYFDDDPFVFFFNDEE